jgi:hypothetical protein
MLVAQTIDPNDTGLPTYPHFTQGRAYQQPQRDSGRTYHVYTAGTGDDLATVEAWYRHALPGAKETAVDNSFTHGIVLTAGNNKVQVYQLGKSQGSVVELWKFLPGQ